MVVLAVLLLLLLVLGGGELALGGGEALAAGGGDARVVLPEEVEFTAGLGEEVELEVPFTGDVRATGGVALVLLVEF